MKHGGEYRVTPLMKRVRAVFIGIALIGVCAVGCGLVLGLLYGVLIGTDVNPWATLPGLGQP